MFDLHIKDVAATMQTTFILVTWNDTFISSGWLLMELSEKMATQMMAVSSSST